MNEEASEAILEHFCKQRGLAVASLSEGAADAICATSAPYLLMIECLDQLEPNDPTGGLLAKLVDRAYGTAAGALALVSLGHVREAETLSRSILESSVTISYIVHQKPQMRLAQFFVAYVKQEREQNRKWELDLQTVPAGERGDHAARIRRKYDALDRYEQFVDLFATHCGLASRAMPGWPGLIDRLTELGRRIEYRTVYAAMCSQAHHDAEDILNFFMVNSVEGMFSLADRMEQETDTFSLFMLLFGLKWFVEATCAVGKHLGFPTVVAEGTVSRDELDRELHMITTHLDSGEFPRRWMTNGQNDS